MRYTIAHGLNKEDYYEISCFSLIQEELSGLPDIVWQKTYML